MTLTTKTMNTCYNCHTRREVGQRVPNIGISVQLPPETNIDDLANIVNQGRYSEIGAEENYLCPTCNHNVSQNELVPTALPKVLLVHTKRFNRQFVNGQMIIRKDQRQIFPTDIILGGVSYRLSSICCHSGSLEGGHYTCTKKCGEGRYVESDDLARGGLQQKAMAGEPLNGYMFMLEQVDTDAQDINIPEPMETANVAVPEEQVDTHQPMETDTPMYQRNQPRRTSENVGGIEEKEEATTTASKLPEMLASFSFAELKVLAKRLDVSLDYLPLNDDEKMPWAVDAIHKKAIFLGHSDKSIEEMVRADEETLVNGFIQKMVKRQVQSVLAKLQVQVPQEQVAMGVAKYRDILRQESQSLKLELHQLQRLTWDRNYLCYPDTKQLMSKPHVEALWRTRRAIELEMELLLKDETIANTVAEKFAGELPKTYEEFCNLLQPDQGFQNFDSLSLKLERQYHNWCMTMNYNISSQDRKVADQALDFKLQLRQMQNPYLYFRKVILPDGAMHQDDPSLHLIWNKYTNNYVEIPETFEALEHNILQFLFSHVHPNPPEDVQEMTTEGLTEGLKATLDLELPIHKMIRPTDLVKMSKFLGLQEKNEAAVVQAIKERFSFSPSIGLMTCCQEALWKDAWEHNVRKSNVVRRRTQSDTTSDRDQQSDTASDRDQQSKTAEAKFKKPQGRAPRKRRTISKPKSNDNSSDADDTPSAAKKSKTFTHADDDYIDMLRKYNTLPNNDESEMEVDEEEFASETEPVKRKRGRPKKVIEPEMTHEEIDMKLHLIRDHGIKNLNQNIR